MPSSDVHWYRGSAGHHDYDARGGGHSEHHNNSMSYSHQQQQHHHQQQQVAPSSSSVANRHHHQQYRVVDDRDLRRGSERLTTNTTSRKSKNKKSGGSSTAGGGGSHRQHATAKEDKYYAAEEQQQQQQRRPEYDDYHTSRDVYQYHQPGREHFPIVKLRPRPSSRKEEEYLTKRKVETKTTKNTEKTVKRKILLGDGRVLEDEVPETVRDTVEDTHVLEEEHLENTRDRIVPRIIHWRKNNKSNNNVIDDSYNRTINTHDVKENLVKTASTQNLGPVSKRVIEKALKDKRPMREVIEQDQRERSSRRKHREHREHRSHRHSNNNNNNSSNIKHEIVPKPKVIYSSKSHKKIIDTEDVHNISRMLDNGKVLTETFRTQEHEVIDDKEAPDDSSQARTSDGSARVIKDKENFAHNKRDEFTEYYRVPKKGSGRSHQQQQKPQLIGRGAHLTTEDKMIEKGAYNWDEMSEKMRQNREKIRQRLHAGEAAERKDALTKKPLNYNQEEKTRKKETDKWLDAHFGSEWSLTSSSINSGQTTLQHKSSSKKQKAAQYDRFGKGVRRSMSFSSIPITYNNGLGGEVQEKTTKTKEKIVKTTTTTYNPAAKGMEKTVFSTITRARTPNPNQAGNNFHISTTDNSNNNMNQQKHYSRSHHNLSQSMDRNYHTLQREAKRDQSYNNSQSVDRNYHTLRREQVASSPTRREIFKPTSPKQFNSTFNLSPLQAEYVLDEPLRPARNAKAKGLFHNQLLPSELSHHGSQASLRSRRDQHKTGGSQIRSASAHNMNQHHHNTSFYQQRDESVSSKTSSVATSTRQAEESHHEERNFHTSNKENVHGNNVHFQTLEKVHHHVPKTEFAKHIVEERVYSSSTPPPKERRVYASVEQDKDSAQNRVVYRSESKRGQDDMVRKPLYITELRREKLYPAASENNLLHDFKKTYSDRGSGSVGGEKIHMSGTFTERFVTDDDYYHKNNSSNNNDHNFGHYKTMPRSYLGYRSMERSDALSVDESAGESKSSGSSGKRKKQRSQSFLVKSTRPQYQYSHYSSPYPRDEGCEEDYVYDRHERKFVNSTGMKHGHSDLRLDKGFQYRLEHEDGGDYGYGLGGSNHNVFSKEIVHQQEQLEPQKFKTIIFLNGN